MIHFRDRLAARQERLGYSALCVGLDPDPADMPESFRLQGRTTSWCVFMWMKNVIDKTARFATMFKFQIACYEAIPGGMAVLRRLIRYCRETYPDIPIFVDAKRADIDRTQLKYRQAIFSVDGVGGTNVSTYMGRTPFLKMWDKDRPDRAIVNLIYTSNPDAREVQDALMADGDPVWLFMARLTLGWIREYGILNAGFVMAAAHEKNGAVFSGHLARCRELDKGSVWYLMPGFGTQGGYVEASVAEAWRGPGSIAMNASSAIGNANDPAEAAGAFDEQIRQTIRETA